MCSVSSVSSLVESYLPGHHVILGRPGSGKSSLARLLTREARRLLVVDTLAEYADSDLARVDDDGLLDALLAAGDDGGYRLAWTPIAESGDPVALPWQFACGASAARCDSTLLLDELDYWLPRGACQPLPGELAAILRYGRHYRQSVVAVVRRPADISRTLTAFATVWAFCLYEPRDRQYIAALGGPDPATLEPHVVARIPGRTGPYDLYRLELGPLRLEPA